MESKEPPYERVMRLRDEGASAWKHVVEATRYKTKPTFEWTTSTFWLPDDIVTVLDCACSHPSLYTVFPKGQGHQLTAAKFATESGLIELTFNSLIRIVAIESVTLYSCLSHPEWSYIYVQLSPIDPISGITVSSHGPFQFLTELAPGVYDEYARWEKSLESGQQSPSPARGIVRVLNGSLVITQLLGPYYRDYTKYHDYQDTATRRAFHAMMEARLEEWAQYGPPPNRL